MIVVDSGSTGSRAHLYQYKFGSGNTPIFIKEIASQHIEPGLASVGQDRHQISAYLSELLADIKKQSDDPIPTYYYATAGMRLLPDDKQRVIYQNVKSWFEAQPEFTLKAAQTISGHDEGVYGWLAVNYLAGTFNNTNVAKQTIGMMDFGGASVQIALSISKPSSSESQDVEDLAVSNRKYHIFAKSFLGVGVNEMSHQFLNNKYCFAKGYPMPNGLEGDGDIPTCEASIELLTNNLHKINQLQDNDEIKKISKWMALGALEGLNNSKPYSSLSNHFNIDDVFELGQQQACQVSWQELKSASPSDKYLYSTCLLGAYYYALIVKGYGLSSQIQIDTKIEGASDLPDWTYGVVIKQHN